MQTFTDNTENLINNMNPVFISDKLNYAFLQPKTLIYKDLNKISKNKKLQISIVPIHFKPLNNKNIVMFQL